MMLLHCGLTENFREMAALYAVDINKRVLTAKAHWAGLRQSPFEKCMKRSNHLVISVSSAAGAMQTFRSVGELTRSNSEQAMFMQKEFDKVGRAWFYHRLISTYGTSGHCKWHPESLYDPNLSNYDVTARIQGAGCVKDYQFLVGATHSDNQDGLLYVTGKVYVEKFPLV